MSYIREKIRSVNLRNEKSLTVFLTAGYPNPDTFVQLVTSVANAGADIIEIGLPFADSLADGPLIQSSYTKALRYGVNLDQTLQYVNEVKEQISTPIILMSSSNPILNYGKEKFNIQAKESGIDGLILPDIPLEEYDDFFDSNFENLDTILLTTPTSSEARIKKIDKKSEGFVYCVSVTGTTGIRKSFDNSVLQNLERTYNLIGKNKMQIGFGISGPENINLFSPYCDGVIVGSAVIKSLEKDDANFSNTLSLISELKSACKN